MREMISIILMKVRDKRGAAAIEYALLAALIAVAIIVTVGTVGTQLNGVFSTVSTGLADAVTATP